MSRSWFISCCSIIVFAAHSTGVPAAQPGGARNSGAPPFVATSFPAVLPSASRVLVPAANPIGQTINPPGLLNANTTTPDPSPPATSATPANQSGTPQPLYPPVLDLARLPTCFEPLPSVNRARLE
jgi:hypothetical protein